MVSKNIKTKKVKLNKSKLKKTKKVVRNLKIMLEGTSSSGKSSILKSFPKHFKKYSVDELHCERECYGKDETYKGVENKYYTDYEINKMHFNYIINKIIKKLKKSNNWVYDYVSNGKKPLDHKNLPDDRKNVLVYTNFKDLVSNMRKRLEYDPRERAVFLQFSNYYIKTNNKKEAIDQINLEKFILELKKIKFLFSNEKDIYTFSKNIFKKMGITYSFFSNHSENYYIKPRYNNYDLIVKTKNKTPEQCKDYILKNI